MLSKELFEGQHTFILRYTGHIEPASIPQRNTMPLDQLPIGPIVTFQQDNEPRHIFELCHLYVYRKQSA